jgi:hypothetical protein
MAAQSSTPPSSPQWIHSLSWKETIISMSPETGMLFVTEGLNWTLPIWYHDAGLGVSSDKLADLCNLVSEARCYLPVREKSLGPQFTWLPPSCSKPELNRPKQN